MKTVIEMAREAGISVFDIIKTVVSDQDGLERFAALVAADEREACAYKAGIALLGADRGLANRVDQAIRARSNT